MMKVKQLATWWIVISVLIFLMVSSASSVHAKDLKKELDKYLNACHDVWKFHGAALVAKDGKVLLKKGYGMANVELGVPNTPEMKFQIGSITKQFTATAIMQLAEKGLLSVDDPITKYLPDYPKETGDKVTIHHLLTHTSGIPSYTSISEFMEKKALPVTLEKLLATFKDKPLEFEPGEKYSYSNSGYIVLGAIIEAVTGKSYEDYVRENIFDLLGMANSGYDHRDKIIKNRAAGYTEDENGNLKNADFVHMSTPYAAGALYSTVEDMLIWDQALYTEKILNKILLEKMFTPFKDNYGYGWLIQERMDRKYIGHDGGIDGFYTSFNRWVDDKVCIVVFGNNDSAPVGKIAQALAAIVFSQPYDIPVIKTPIQVDPSLFADYQGVYQVEENVYRFITIEEDSLLFSQRTGGQRLRMFPEAQDRFFLENDHTITIKFVRDQNGKVVEHVIHQNGEDQVAGKLEGEKAQEIMAQKEMVAVDPAIYEKYVGQYKLNIGLDITVRTEQGKILIQATGQPEVEIFPKSETEYFLKIVDAQITFIVDEAGKVTGMILHQAGQDFPGEKIK